jgi:hypothetical protein
MSDGAPDSLIPYDEIVQDALRAVVGRVLGQVEKGGGLPGNHHFFITFKTAAPGVDIPKHLTDRYPDEMTIVIQNRFWDLHVSATGFEVGLSFNQVGSKLSIPFAAITAFQDPAVDFALHFSAQADNVEPEEIAAPENDPVVRQVEDGSNVVSVDFTRKK